MPNTPFERILGPIHWRVLRTALIVFTAFCLLSRLDISFRHFSIPLAIFDRNQGNIAQTRIGIRQAEEQQKATSGQALTDVRDAYEALQEGARIAQLFLSRYLEVAKKSRDISEYAYHRGALALLDFLDAERTYRATQLAYRQAIAAYLTALEQLRQAVGTRSLP